MSKPAELARLRHAFLSSPEEIIEEAKNGRMFILVDDEDRENEGDLVIPAQFATPAAVDVVGRTGETSSYRATTSVTDSAPGRRRRRRSA